MVPPGQEEPLGEADEGADEYGDEAGQAHDPHEEEFKRSTADNRFENFANLFENLTVATHVHTATQRDGAELALTLVDVIINATSSHILALCKGDDSFF